MPPPLQFQIEISLYLRACHQTDFSPTFALFTKLPPPLCSSFGEGFGDGRPCRFRETEGDGGVGILDFIVGEGVQSEKRMGPSGFEGPRENDGLASILSSSRRRLPSLASVVLLLLSLSLELIEFEEDRRFFLGRRFDWEFEMEARGSSKSQTEPKKRQSKTRRKPKDSVLEQKSPAEFFAGFANLWKCSHRLELKGVRFYGTNGLREADYTARDPVGLDLFFVVYLNFALPAALEDAVVLIVGHFCNSSKQRIRFPNSDDCVCGKENSGRVEDPGEGFARRDQRNHSCHRMSSVPFIISTLSGIFGRDALTHEFKEVKWREVCGDGSDEDCSIPAKDVM
ncbi:hypothetical protein ACFX11_007560 [Malus domestica]